jgi:hypothetical protein
MRLAARSSRITVWRLTLFCPKIKRDYICRANDGCTALFRKRRKREGEQLEAFASVE